MKVVCREIGERDLDGVADCLARNFPRRSRAFFRRWLADLAGSPRFGHLIEADGRVVGALIEIVHASILDGAPPPRCNFSSWCVDPPFRGFALALPKQALRDAGVTYLNLTPAPHTLRSLEALRFARYAEGAVLAAPLLSPAVAHARLIRFECEAAEARGLSPWERAMLGDHARLGFDALIGVHDGAATPFVLKMWPLWRRFPPAAELVYARSESDVAMFARALGRHCLAKGRWRLIVSANGPIAGLAGRFRPGRAPHYFRGPCPPATTDLAYTELIWL